MIRISDIVEKVEEYAPEADPDIINRAYVFSAQAHAGQLRLNGEPYLSHPLSVADILADMKLDPVSIAAGLLHDVLEDCEVSAAELEELFGADVVRIVAGVTKMSKIKTSDKQHRQAESIRRMILAMADDIRVIMIKLADRLHNMRTLEFQSPEKRVKISRETLDIYASIASRLGIFWIKNELEEISFKYLNPEEYRKIETLVSESQKVRDKYVETVRDYIRKKLEQNNFDCEVLGRNKTYFSIYNKMISQNLPFEEIYDIIAFRIILDTIPQCYAVLGLIHSMWSPIDRKFKDYIARPKPNSYQSLHTTVVGPLGRRIEIQIRTKDMDNVAKSGIAAHWNYKEGGSIDDETRQKMVWLQNLLENQEYFQDPDEFIKNVKLDLFPDDVYVFTPNGDVKTLPLGATPVDFAYMIHSEIGNQCVGAKVNGIIVPLKYTLKTGDIVEIITAKNHTPSKDWLKFVQTVKARSKIRQWIKTQDKERSIQLGRDLLIKFFHKSKQNFNSLAKTPQMHEIVSAFGFKTLDDLLANVGYGKITPLQVYHRFFPQPVKEVADDHFDKDVDAGKEHAANNNALIVGGINDVLVRFGACCNPIPGDAVTGYITRGHGVTVHRDTCRNVRDINHERTVEVAWLLTDGARNALYPVKIKITSLDRVGLLADMSSYISKEGGNITKVASETQNNQTVETLISLMVKNTEHLSRIENALRRVKNVQQVERIA